MSKRFELAKQYTEKYKDRLHPCKYCGNKDVRVVSDRQILGVPCDVWSVCCSTPYCDCTGSYRSVKDAVACWEHNH